MLMNDLLGYVQFYDPTASGQRIVCQLNLNQNWLNHMRSTKFRFRARSKLLFDKITHLVGRKDVISVHIESSNRVSKVL